MTPDIICKLETELKLGINSEIQVVYLLAMIRKLIERDQLYDKFVHLKFHCDWALHSRMDRTTAKTILNQFDVAHELLCGTIEISNLPSPLRHEIERISKMISFEKELSQFLSEYSLSPLTLFHSDGWTRFLLLYTKVIEDIPLVVSIPSAKNKPKQSAPDLAPKHISHVTVQCESARETFKHTDGEEVFFKVTWTIHDKNGQSGDIFIINSFSSQHS